MVATVNSDIINLIRQHGAIRVARVSSQPPARVRVGGGRQISVPYWAACEYRVDEVDGVLRALFVARLGRPRRSKAAALRDARGTNLPVITGIGYRVKDRDVEAILSHPVWRDALKAMAESE